MKMAPSKSLIYYLFILVIVFPALISASDYTNLVFKGCADRNFPDSNGGYQETLKTLLNTLTSQSSAAKFSKTTSGDGASAINGLFQCRGDLSGDDCNKCVKRAAFMAHLLCRQAMAVRVHLTGCYLRYEIAGFRQTSGSEFLYKVCGSTRASGSGFGDRLSTALGEVVKGVGSGGNGGFYAGGYQSVYVLGQCEGDLGNGDCVDCVKTAVDRAQSDCASSISAQIYLQQCYISYTYYPNGVPRNQKTVSSSGDGKGTQKTVAIVLGGVVGVGLLMACLLFTKSVFKKKTQHTFKYGG
ncbi:plasmodesmata-located protein 2-like [Andrographis paniculata]|uniref:plasmodesmata-located protein 2-like n=1 Tax=Andrographis paniculata TaxID=175694 RepID=UPI0021E8A62C|nr:plasmodesmata-located protein 2-like [Andrographis paniculata]XP_051120611.1 plasmodesmata-located protein 2-like [Andrographis paniculata]XP_051120612.1 plasmodesmata-located protein 2-like [Andrographis paniculata]